MSGQTVGIHLRLDHVTIKNTLFDCGNDKKDMVANSVRKDL